MGAGALYFASGESLYLGATLLFLAVVTAPLLGSRLSILRNLATWTGLAFIVMACPPFSWWMDATDGIVFLLWLVAQSRGKRGRTWAPFRTFTSMCFLLGLATMLASEFSHRRIPSITGTPGNHLVVLGDSISAGIHSRAPAWPTILEHESGVPVRNLSRAGARVSDARVIAANVLPQDTVVLLEIGGNDLLSDEPSAEFGEGLDLLLSTLAVRGRTIVMFELPLLPHRIAYGQIQRRLAARYGVFLIPKRFFAGVLSGSDSTSDGLHLSQVGAHRMATLVAQVLSPMLVPARKSAELPTL